MRPWLLCLFVLVSAAEAKLLSFNDTDIHYHVASKDSTIKVSRFGDQIQTINFRPALVDFDLQCQPKHCYLVAITRKNVELYTWKRTQFDLLARRDSFAIPHGVKIFRINTAFYIALAQDQQQLLEEDEEPKRFVGCTIFKFFRGHESGLKYHQFIRMPFNPMYVNHFTSPSSSQNSINSSPSNTQRQSENHYLVFSLEPNAIESPLGGPPARSFIWSPLDDYFWPYRIPRGVEVNRRPGAQILTFPSQQLQRPLNLTQAAPITDPIEPIEACFSQLQRLLNDRDLYARRLINTSRSLWRASPQHDGVPFNGPPTDLSDISAQVIVHGNVIVKGSVIHSPQITLFGHQPPQSADRGALLSLVKAHSPALVEHKLKQALIKLKFVRTKLARAVISNLPINSFASFDSPVRFYGNVQARKVTFRGSGIANSNVRLNGLPFRQLEHELVSLRGEQDIAPKVVFRGNVVADLLEIHGTINGHYRLIDALDITSRNVQVIEPVSHPNGINWPPLSAANLSSQVSFEFMSVSAPELIMSHNATINEIRLDEFITRDNRTQVVRGPKHFKHLSMGQLNLANPSVPLNGFDISRLALNSIHLRDPTGNSNKQHYQTINANHLTFSKPVTVDRLVVNNVINNHINLSSLIYDSVKTNEVFGQQQISGHKHFVRGLKIAQLSTEGSINNVKVSEVFNLNPPPVSQPLASDYARHSQVTGRFVFTGPIMIDGNLNADLINNVDISRRAILRTTTPVPPSGFNASSLPLQIVSGRKIFSRPLRVTNSIRLHTSPMTPYPMINGLDIRRINEGIKRQIERPSIIYIENLEIDGNLNLPTSLNRTGEPRTTFGNYSVCPLDLIRSKLVLSGHEDQLISAPIRINSLRSKSVYLEPGSLNGMSFPEDFVLRSLQQGINPQVPIASAQVESVFGHKTFEHLSVASPPPPPSPMRASVYDRRGEQPMATMGPLPPFVPQSIVFGSASSINNITYTELQTFLRHERQRNSTGETVLQTLNVHGTIRARKVNGYYWPDDILLKSIGSHSGPIMTSPYLHKRIYSPLIFLNSSDLVIENQLVLRGPIQLAGQLNGVNLTEFARQSATYGDKDLLSLGRPIRNKVFLGGLTVTGEIRSQGLIDGVNIEEMKNRVVTVGPSGNKRRIIGQKIFMSDVDFQAPLSVNYLNDLPLDHYLRRINLKHDQGNHIQISGKKTITGTLRINKNLLVQGLVNGIDFVDLKARAIPLSPTNDEIQFNKTLTIEGDVFLDNLLIDEKDGVIDGVRLTNLLPIGDPPIGKNEIYISAPVLTRRNMTQGYDVNLVGQVNDCTITCSLTKTPANLRRPPRSISVLSDQKKLAVRRPVAINYEKPNVLRNYLRNHDHGQLMPMVVQQLDVLRSQIVSLNLVRLSAVNNLVVGFIEASSNDIGNLVLPERDFPHSGHIINPHSFLQLDQIDFPFRPTTYHLSVGVATSSSYHKQQNITSVFSSLGGGQPHQLSVLPIESPNSAMFLKIADQQTLFLLISQDYTTFSSRSLGAQCPPYGTNGLPATMAVTDLSSGYAPPQQQYASHNKVMGGIHVYLFHALQNSSSLTSAYFDLYQTIDLPAIDSFEHFDYRGSTYALAVSRATSRVYLLLLRGYSGFQIVSFVHTPEVEYVKIIYTADEQRPALIIYQSNGLHRLMESVII